MRDFSPVGLQYAAIMLVLICCCSFLFLRLVAAGFYQGKPSANTRKLLKEAGGLLYDSDAYDDDLPYWSTENREAPHLIIPYTLSENDMKFVSPNGFSNGQDFATYLKDSLK